MHTHTRLTLLRQETFTARTSGWPFLGSKARYVCHMHPLTGRPVGDLMLVGPPDTDRLGSCETNRFVAGRRALLIGQFVVDKSHTPKSVGS